MKKLLFASSALSLFASAALAYGFAFPPGVTQTGSVTTNDCANWSATGVLADAGAACGSGTGTVGTSGTPANGQLTKFSGASTVTNGDLNGDVTTSGTLAATVANGAINNAKMAVGAAVANIGFTPLSPANNLSEVTAATARTNLGLASAALASTGSSGHTVPFLDGTLTFSGANAYGTPSSITLTNATAMATGSTTTRSLAVRFAQQINVKDYGALGNALTFADGVITSGTNAFSSASATFTSADVGKTIQIDGASGVAAAPLVTTIATYVDANDVTLASNATATVPLSYLANPTVATAQASGSYVPGDTLTFTGGTSSVGAVVTVRTTKVVSSSINAAGSGGTNGACVLTGTTGSGTVYKINATISGGAVTALGAVVGASHYFTNPTSLSAEPVTSSCGVLTGATLALVMGVDNAYVSTAGNYSVLPTNPVATGAGGTSGAAGATFTAAWTATGTGVYATDDTAAFTAAINQSATLWAANSPILVYAAAANYYIGGAALPIFSSYGGGFTGDGHNKTNLVVGAAYSGDLFSWSEAWLASSIPFNGASPQIVTQRAGPTAKGFTIVGDRLAAAQQNALMLYDRDDFVNFDDIDVQYLNGRGLASGIEKNQTQAYLRESRFNRMRFFNVGQSGVPVVEFTSQGSGAADSEVNVSEFDLYAPYGPGVVVRNANTNTDLRDIKFRQLRIEGLEGDPANISADFLAIGDAGMSGTVDNISVDQALFIDPNAGGYAIHLNSGSAPSKPYSVTIGGAIKGGIPLGGGVKIDAGTALTFRLSAMNTDATNITVASSALVGPNLLFYGTGLESQWTYSIDSTTVNNVVTLPERFGNPQSATISAAPYFSLNVPDNTTFGGNARGIGSVDFSTIRDVATAVAGGLGSVVAGGRNNTASGSYSFAGGWGNIASGTYTVALGNSSQATALGSSARGIFALTNKIACDEFGAATLLANAQAGTCILRAIGVTGTSAARLTADGNAASTTNSFNLGNNSIAGILVQTACHDVTTTANNYSSHLPDGLLTRGANAASTAFAAGIAISHSSGSTVGAAIATTADTTNGGLNISFTPPTGNTDTWDCAAAIQSAETL